MTWTPFVPPAAEIARTSKSAAPVTLSTTEGKGNFKPRVYLSVRAPLAAEIGWWTTGAAVSVAIGTGDHAGMLRITPDATGPYVLRSSGGKDLKKAAVMLVLPLLPGMVRAVRPSLAAEHDYADDWLEVTLPPWEPVAPAVPTVFKPTASAPNPPFRGIGSTTPDPMVRKTQDYVTRKVGAGA